MLATLPAERVDGLVARALPGRLTRQSVADRGALERQLLAARASGYAVDDEETAEGMNCFGAPVYAAGGGQAVAAVGVSLIKSTTTAQRRAQVIASIRELARRLSARLGGPDERG